MSTSLGRSVWYKKSNPEEIVVLEMKVRFLPMMMTHPYHRPVLKFCVDSFCRLPKGSGWRGLHCTVSRKAMHHQLRHLRIPSLLDFFESSFHAFHFLTVFTFLRKYDFPSLMTGLAIQSATWTGQDNDDYQISMSLSYRHMGSWSTRRHYSLPKNWNKENLSFFPSFSKHLHLE